MLSAKILSGLTCRVPRPVPCRSTSRRESCASGSRQVTRSSAATPYPRVYPTTSCTNNMSRTTYARSPASGTGLPGKRHCTCRRPEPIQSTPRAITTSSLTDHIPAPGPLGLDKVVQPTPAPARVDLQRRVVLLLQLPTPCIPVCWPHPGEECVP